jgi:hypothetical protein
MIRARLLAAGLGFFAASAIACTPSQEPLLERVKLMYEHSPIVAHVRLGSPLGVTPERFSVDVIESFKGPAPASVSRETSTCGFGLEEREGQELIVFVYYDGGPIRTGAVVWKHQFEAALPALRQLRLQPQPVIDARRRPYVRCSAVFSAARDLADDERTRADYSGKARALGVLARELDPAVTPQQAHRELWAELSPLVPEVRKAKEQPSTSEEFRSRIGAEVETCDTLVRNVADKHKSK